MVNAFAQCDFNNASAEGRIISKIVLNKNNIFDLSDPQESRTIHQLANRLHTPTKDRHIHQLVHIKVGERYQQSLVNEAERRLRATGYLIDISITPTIVCDGTVEMSIRTKDVWSIIPLFTFSDSDGKTIYNANIQNINLFGLGQNLTMGVQSESSNQTFRAFYRAPFLFGTRFDLISDYASGDEIESGSLRVQKPFRGLNDTQSYGVTASESDALLDIHLRNEPFYAYQSQKNSFGLFYGWSKGLYDHAVRRYQMSWHTREQTYTDQRSLVGGVTPLENIHRDSIRFSYNRFTDEFIQIRNFRTIHRVEDLFVGRSWSAHLGYARDRHSTKRHRIEYSLSHLNTPWINEKNIFFYRTRFSGEWLPQENVSENAVMGLSAEYFWLPKDNHRLSILISREWGKNLTLDTLFTQGGHHTLRGYPEYYQLGNQRLGLTIEKRFFYDWELWRLLRFATVAYLDTGRAWFTESSFNTLNYIGDKQLTNIGVGLRGVSNRADLYSIGHINIALPLTEVPELSGDQIGINVKSIRISIGVYTRI